MKPADGQAVPLHDTFILYTYGALHATTTNRIIVKSLKIVGNVTLFFRGCHIDTYNTQEMPHEENAISSCSCHSNCNMLIAQYFTRSVPISETSI